MTTHDSSLSFTKALTAGLIGGLIAAVINTVLYFVFQGINGGPLLVTPPGTSGMQPLVLAIVLFASIAPGLVAGALYWVLVRFTNKAERWFLIISALVFVAFFFTPLNGASGAVAIWALELMHVGVAVPVIWSLLKRT